MSKENTKTISILTVQAQKGPETMFPSPTKMIVSYTQVATEKLKDNMSEFVKLLDEIVQTLPKSCGAYDVDTLTFSLSLDGSGKISLVGELSAGFTSGITISLKKKGEIP